MATIERIIPLLTYQDIAAAHDFLVSAFGFSSGGVHRTSEGTAVHGGSAPAMRRSGFITWDPGSTRRRPSMSRIPAWLCTWTTSTHISSTPARLEHASTASLIDQPYGQREYGARDPEGHRWCRGAGEQGTMKLLVVVALRDVPGRLAFRSAWTSRSSTHARRIPCSRAAPQEDWSPTHDLSPWICHHVDRHR